MPSKCMEAKIRRPHHNFSEAVRHPGPASNLERYGEQRRQRAPMCSSQKQNRCRILSVCVRAYVCMSVCVCVGCIHGLKEVIVLRHEVQPNLLKETIQLCDGLSCVDTHGKTSRIRWHSPTDSLS